MTIEKITINEFLNNIYSKYESLFPEIERRNFDKIEKCYNDGVEKFYVFKVNDITVGFVLLEKLYNDYPYYIDYFGIFHEYQNQGYGTMAIKILINMANNGLCFEIEKENEGTEEENIIRHKRALFYKNLGFKEINSTYLLFDVLFTPYVYDTSNKLNKEKVDKILLDYYLYNNQGSDKNIKILN